MRRGYPPEARTPEQRRIIDKLIDDVQAFGYVVVREKSYRQAQERQRIAECRARNSTEWRESTERWARTDLHNEIRTLYARVTALYGAARAHGATAEELANLSWPTAGINCPFGHDCEGKR